MYLFLFSLELLTIKLMLDDKFKNKKLNQYELCFGYYYKFGIRFPVIIDMKITPHVFVSGLSNMGKSKSVEYALKDKKNIILINTFRKDFKNITSARRVNGNDNILKFLTELIKNIHFWKDPLYLVFDELLILSLDKKIQEKIFFLLCNARHYNIYLIAISQNGIKENIKFKDLFNVRLCFRQVEESSYRSVLGYSPTDKNLGQQEFHIYSDKILKCKTYNF